MRTITIRGAILVITKKIIAENASFQGYFTEVCFDTLKGNQQSHFQYSKIAIFSKFFGDFMRHRVG